MHISQSTLTRRRQRYLRITNSNHSVDREAPVYDRILLFTRFLSDAFLSVNDHFRKRKILSVVMPKPSPRLHLPRSVACDEIKTIPELSHRTFTSNTNLDCKMNVRKLLESIPQIQRAYETESDSGCSLRARKKHDRHDGSAVMVFKVSGAGRKKRPCGMLNCPPCGALWREYLFAVI